MIQIAQKVLAPRRTDDVRLLLQIHDELIFEVKDDIIKGSRAGDTAQHGVGISSARAYPCRRAQASGGDRCDFFI